MPGAVVARVVREFCIRSAIPAPGFCFGRREVVGEAIFGDGGGPGIPAFGAGRAVVKAVERPHRPYATCRVGTSSLVAHISANMLAPRAL